MQTQTNPALDAIFSRRSMRRFKAEQIPDDVLGTIIEAGRHAPTGSNTQLVHFMVIQNQDVFAKFRQIATSAFSQMEITEGMYKGKIGAIRASKAGEFNFTYSAPTLVVVANKITHPNAMAGCTCAMENMMIAAQSLGIGSCWINQLHWLDEAQDAAFMAYMHELGMGGDETVCASLALGYPDMTPPPLQRNGMRVTYIK